MPARRSCLCASRKGVERWVRIKVSLAMSSQTFRASLACSECLAVGETLRHLRREALVDLHPGLRDDPLITAGRGLHRQIELHDLSHIALDRADVGEAGSFGHPADRLTDAVAAHERHGYRVEHLSDGVVRDARCLEARNTDTRGAERHRRAPEFSHGGRVGSHAFSADTSQRAGQLRLAVEPALRHLRLLVVQVFPAVRHLFPRDAGHEHILTAVPPVERPILRGGGRSLR